MPTRGNLLSSLLLSLILFSSAFAQAEKKIAYCVLIDNTGSLRSQFNDVLMLAKGVVGRIHQEGPVSLFNFMTKGDFKNGQAVATPGIEWSQNEAAINNYIDSLYIQPGQTMLFDSISLIAEYLNAKADVEKNAFESKEIILITDGEDRVSKIKDKQLIEKLKESKIKVYAIGLTRELGYESGFTHKSTKEKAKDFLRSVTKETGGVVIFSEAGYPDTNKLLEQLFAVPARK